MNRRRTGGRYERLAAEFLEEKGYRILERNYRNRYGEIDLIAAAPDDCLVMVEVKYRGTRSCGDPLEAVDAHKQFRISRTAAWYYMDRHLPLEKACRFDVIGIYPDGRIVHVENAFDYRG